MNFQDLLRPTKGVGGSVMANGGHADGLEKATPLTKMAILGIYVRFLECFGHETATKPTVSLRKESFEPF